MNRQTWMLIGVVAAIAIVTGFVVNRKASQEASDSASQSQLPATEEAANYTVPPSIGAQVNSTGGLNFPAGGNFTITPSQGLSLPITPTQ
jgi:hypothetical protein